MRSGEGPDTGRPIASSWSTDAAENAVAAFASIQAPVWQRVLAARAESNQEET